MMDGRTVLVILVAAVLAAGCVQPAQELGCCLKNYTKNSVMYDVTNRVFSDDNGRTWKDLSLGNASVKAGYGCMLYNMSDISGVTKNPNKYDYTGATSGNYGTCNESDKGTVSACNVTIGTTSGNQKFIIPICTQNDLVGCVNGDCTAMVCGDFKFTPRVAPGFPATASETDPTASATSQSSGALPAGNPQTPALQFYKAQCRFLPMDDHLKSIMKSSSSEINVFRMGAGGSFDEFDQYRYYFPISDQYCAVNNAGTVDRYMNYLTITSSGTPLAYDPVRATSTTQPIASNCVDDASKNVPAPLAFGETTAQRSATATLPGPKTQTFSYNPVVPDRENYNFVDYARFDNASDPQPFKVFWFASTYLQPMINYYSTIYSKPCINSSPINVTSTNSYGVTFSTYKGYTCKDEKTGSKCEGATNGCVDNGAPCYAGGTSGYFNYLCISSTRAACSGTSCVNFAAPCYTSGSGYLCYGAGLDKTKPCVRTTSNTTALCISPSGTECTGNSCINTSIFCAAGTTGSGAYLCIDPNGAQCSKSSCIGTTPCAFSNAIQPCINKVNGATCPTSGNTCIDGNSPCAKSSGTALCIASNGAQCSGSSCFNTGTSCAVSTTGSGAYLCVDSSGNTCNGNCVGSTPCAFSTSAHACIAGNGATCPTSGNTCIDGNSPCAKSSGTALCIASNGAQCSGSGCISSTPCATNSGTSLCVDSSGNTCHGNCVSSTPCALSTSTYSCINAGNGATCPTSGTSCTNSIPCTKSTGTFLCIGSNGQQCTSGGPLFIPCGHQSTGYRSTGHLSSGHTSTGHQAIGYKSTGHSSTGLLSIGHRSTGYNSTGHKSTGHQSTGYAYSPCIDAFYQCTDSDTSRHCTQTWQTGSNGGYLNTTCLTKVPDATYDETTCEYGLSACTDEVGWSGGVSVSPSFSTPGAPDYSLSSEGALSCMTNSVLDQSGMGQQGTHYNQIGYDTTYACQDQYQSTVYYYKYDRPAPVSVFKTIDTGYYSKELSIASTGLIYDLDNKGTTRASFECDTGSDDCFSGTCDTQTYSRSVMLDSSDLTKAQDVVTDCDQFTDSAGIKIVTCAPTESVAAPQGGKPPVRTYGSVTLIPTRMERMVTDSGQDELIAAGTITNGSELDTYWNWTKFKNLGTPYDVADAVITTTGTWPVTNVTTISWQPQVAYKDCKNPSQVEQITGHNPNAGFAAIFPSAPTDTTTQMWCPNVNESSTGPPLGGIVFFGLTGTDGQTPVSYNGNTIIGYSLLDEADFKNTLLYKNCGLQPGDYIPITLSDPRDSQLTATNGLLDAFKPYFDQRVKGLATTLGTSKVNAFSAVFSYMPWVATFQKGTYRIGNYVGYFGRTNTMYNKPSTDDSVGFTWLGDFLSSPSAQDIRQHNTYDEEMDQIPGTTAAELDAKLDPWGGTEYTDELKCGYHDVLGCHHEGKAVYHTYNLAFSKYIILIKYNPDGMLGRCAIDTTSHLPVLRTFGWCEPCTMSTLAFQNITANATAYLPLYSAVLNKTGADTYNTENVQTICSSAIHTDTPPTTDNATCFNQDITDMGDYSGGSPGVKGAPRTIPEATILKERLGNYMKSGVLPVLDLSDASNWNLTHVGTVGSTLTPLPNYTQYDFQDLFGTMGAAVVIVDHVSTAADAKAKLNEIVQRSGTVKQKCTGCLTAFQVDTSLSSGCAAGTAPPTSRCFNSTVKAVLSDPTAYYNLDMVTFDYPVTLLTSQPSWSVNHPGWAAMDLENKSKTVVDDVASYGRTALQAVSGGGKPSMVIGFSVDTNDPTWTDNTVAGIGTCTDKTSQVQPACAAVQPNPNPDKIPLCPFGTFSSSASCNIDTPTCSKTTDCVKSNGLYTCTITTCNARKAARGNFTTLFDAVAENQGELVKAGVTGIIYSPLRTSGTIGTGFVDNSTGVGLKTDKFCSLEAGMQRMTASAPVAIFSRILAQNVSCVPCSASDKQPGGRCSNPGTQLECDDGNPCIMPTALPPGYSADEMRCPAGAVTDKCTPCTNDGALSYACTYSYSDATTSDVNGSMANLVSDSYSDIIASLPWPQKCCIKDPASGDLYSYSKQSYASPLTKPVVFPGIGDPNVDCGMGGDTDQISQISSFCGYSLPLKQYDINCTVTQ